MIFRSTTIATLSSFSCSIDVVRAKVLTFKQNRTMLGRIGAKPMTNSTGPRASGRPAREERCSRAETRRQDKQSSLLKTKRAQGHTERVLRVDERLQHVHKEDRCVRRCEQQKCREHLHHRRQRAECGNGARRRQHALASLHKPFERLRRLQYTRFDSMRKKWAVLRLRRSPGLHCGIRPQGCAVRTRVMR